MMIHCLYWQATLSVDGILRIYEAMDVINLAHWTLMVRLTPGGGVGVMV